jgi:integrase
VRLGTRKTKTSEVRYRWVRMNDMLFDALQDQWKTKLPRSDYVFQNRDSRSSRYGERYTVRQRFVKDLCEDAEIRSFGFHALRRFFGSLLADKYKESIPVIQKILGHASPVTTERYVFNISEDVKKAVDQIELSGFTPDFYTKDENIGEK